MWSILLAMAALAGAEVPVKMSCEATQSAGFHDYPHNQEAYEAVVFFESHFTLTLNKALTRHLAGVEGTDIYLTLASDGELTELSCKRVLGLSAVPGLSCTNAPPAQLLLLNLQSFRFTRTAIGGWTFAGAHENTSGDSIFVEYGQCAAG